MLALLLLAAAALPDERAPAADVPRGKVHEWKGPTGAFQYVVPESYDTKRGAALLLMLHGSNLGRQWALLNFEPGRFRKDDIIVAPDGTTPNGQGGFNFMAEAADAAKVADLIRDLRKRLSVSRVYVYGHSQGAYFTYYFIGEYPELVDGVCAHAGGVLTWSKFPEKAKKIAVGILHSDDDPVVPVSLSEGAEKVYKEKGYANVFFKRTSGRQHMPDAPSTSEVLAWCDRLTTRSPEETVKLAEEAIVAERPEYAVAWDLAEKSVAAKAGEELKKRAQAVQAKIEKIAAAHADSVLKGVQGDAKALPADPAYGPWTAHYRLAVSEFGKTKALAELQKKLGAVLRKHAAAARGRLATLRAAGAKNQLGIAFKAGRELIEDAFLGEGADEARGELEKWLARYRSQLPKAEVDTFEKLTAARKPIDEEGRKAWEAVEAGRDDLWKSP
jgi:predicted esterase